MENKTLLITGGAGYIGSHTTVEFIKAGFECVIVDDFSNSSVESIKRQEIITGIEKIQYYEVNILDKKKLSEVFMNHKFEAVIHFAGYKAVGESVKVPLKYYQNNISGTLVLLECMKEHNVNKIIFSSSSTVYGEPQFLPLTEKHPLGGCANPYGTTKYMIELILKDLCNADSNFHCISLRYFNPVGAHESGLIGEDPQDIPNNLMPYITQVAVGRLNELSVYGNDYNTPDGTGVRDYIHVVDLALGHVAALNKIIVKPQGYQAYNLGTGNGISVLEVINAMNKTLNRDLPYKFASRRLGDIASNYADCSLAAIELGWRAERDINKMCEDSWRFQSKNPMGYNVK
ncbi:UDP-glucose 4-epimerase [Hydra vulgaris]|uniref:UDP-glucose 4-epimerase n=1 Tax=Hydra vulgaris TaxID=6087 RepID=A0ABM4D2J2_HYDVU